MTAERSATEDYKAFRKALEDFDVPYDPLRTCTRDKLAALRNHFEKDFKKRQRKMSLLGIDIYRYSHMPQEEQQLIPSLFTLLRAEALSQCKAKEEFLFDDDPTQPADRPVGAFISTGDGGFQAFATPLHAIVFAINFESYLTAFNSSFHQPTLRAIFERPVTVRYTLTHDLVFEQYGDIFGTGIINNARIIARDSLNRFLVDEGTVSWFQTQLPSLESLLTLRSTDLPGLRALHGDSRKASRSALFASNGEGVGIRSVHLQKIGLVTSKSTSVDIFNLVVQVAVRQGAETGTAVGRTAVITIGNLNTTGIAI